LIRKTFVDTANDERENMHKMTEKNTGSSVKKKRIKYLMKENR
jgi:hypothetical protein